ncbi:MAG: hypothetical protein WBW94_17620 [Anaerolineales bacterium]
MGKLSIYGWPVLGRLRFFLGNRNDNIISVGDLDALFSSHVISSTLKTPAEYRVLVLGDSQTWGATLIPAQTLTEQLNSANLIACGRHLKFYNLSFPYPSVVKDFIILNRSLRYKPDFVIWMVAPDSLIPSAALNFLTNGNPQFAIAILHQYHLDRYANSIIYKSNFWDRTLVGQRSHIASLFRLQIYGPLWAATGLDYQLTKYKPLDVNLQASQSFLGFQPPSLASSIFAFDVLEAAHTMLGNTPVLVANEPIYIAPGENSNIRYNSDYPHWAYDQYRQILQAFVAQTGWMYLDLYNLIPYQEFTNSNLHLNPIGEVKLAKTIAPAVLHFECP